MKLTERKEHWNKIYSTRKLEEVSWYQPIPETSLKIIEGLNLGSGASILDIGGGDSFLVDHLIQEGYEDVNVLDVSERAIDRAKTRLGSSADKAYFAVSDIIEFEPDRQYDLWHDRAVLHFLTEDREAEKYVSILKQSLAPGGYVIIGEFSKDGPTKCSGMEVRQYDEASLSGLLGEEFEVLQSFRTDHPTPSGKTQNFVFEVFRKRA